LTEAFFKAKMEEDGQTRKPVDVFVNVHYIRNGRGFVVGRYDVRFGENVKRCNEEEGVFDYLRKGINGQGIECVYVSVFNGDPCMSMLDFGEAFRKAEDLKKRIRGRIGTVNNLNECGSN
jgi:hypothetical protein